MFQGAIAAAEGGNFWQGAAIGAASSGIASNTQGGGPVAQMAMGAFTGGAVAEITGGNFVEGFATGLTVSALNHALHELISKPIALNRMRDALDVGGIDPDGIPPQEISSIDNLTTNVEELARLYEEGGKPKFKIRNIKDLGIYDHPTRTVDIAPRAFTSYLRLAYTVGHELVHAVHFHSGLYSKLIRTSSNGVAVREYSEYLGRQWETQWGNSDAFGYMAQHKNNVLKSGWFRKFEIINSSWKN